MNTRFAVMAVAIAGAALAGCASGPTASTTAAATPMAPVTAVGKSVPGDVAIPIAELMPLTMRFEVELQLTPAQVKALADYRTANMPNRVAGQKNLLALRGNLRKAMLDNAPQAERDALMRQIVEAELAHMQARNRCVEFMRQTLTPQQYAMLTERYLAGLR